MMLTPREAEVARLIACGLPDREIGNQLSIKRSTVRFYIDNILGKTGLGNRVEIAVWVFRHGLMSVDDAWKGITHVARS